MSVPFCMGKIIDIIYNSSQDTTQMVETLSFVCKILCGVFLLGGAANFGRVYLIQVSGKRQTLYIVYIIESAACRVLLMSCLCQKPERARYEQVRAFDTNNK